MFKGRSIHDGLHVCQFVGALLLAAALIREPNGAETCEKRVKKTRRSGFQKSKRQ